MSQKLTASRCTKNFTTTVDLPRKRYEKCKVNTTYS